MEIPTYQAQDFMHIEKNFCENIINTIMDVSNKRNARLNLEQLYEGDELHLHTRENRNSSKPKAKYTVSL